MFGPDIAVAHPDGDGRGRLDDPLHARGDVAGGEFGGLAEADSLPDPAADLVVGDALFLEDARGDPVPLRQKTQQKVFAPDGRVPHLRGEIQGAVERVLRFFSKADGHG